MELYRIFDRNQYSQAYVFAKENNYTIKRIGDNQYQIVEKTVPEQPEPTKDEVEAIRAELYRVEVDPITSQIQRLRDEEQTEEIVAEIEALKAKRSVKVTEIKENNPYPVDKVREENPYIIEKNN